MTKEKLQNLIKELSNHITEDECQKICEELWDAGYVKCDECGKWSEEVINEDGRTFLCNTCGWKLGY
jgi:translation initiation factor 2 beta subunit (eIF-2beta)/eIF-5